MKRRAFTLIEILVVITIIAVMLAAGAVTYSSVTKKSRDAKRRSDMGQIQQALELFRSDTMEYPSCGGATLQDATCLQAAVAANGTPFSEYMNASPADPKTSSGFMYYYYRPNPSTYYLTSFLESDISPGVVTGCPTLEGPYGSYQYCVRNP